MGYPNRNTYIIREKKVRENNVKLKLKTNDAQSYISYLNYLNFERKKINCKVASIIGTYIDIDN